MDSKNKQRVYSGEFKQTVVETLRREHLSYNEAARRFGIGGHTRIRKWERIYLEEGPQGLYSEKHRALRTAGSPKAKPDDAMAKLVAENYRLKMENDYLKKLNALVLEEEQRDKEFR